jgi:hypothetical protein
MPIVVRRKENEQGEPKPNHQPFIPRLPSVSPFYLFFSLFLLLLFPFPLSPHTTLNLTIRYPKTGYQDFPIPQPSSIRVAGPVPRPWAESFPHTPLIPACLLLCVRVDSGGGFTLPSLLRHPTPPQLLACGRAFTHVAH